MREIGLHEVMRTAMDADFFERSRQSNHANIIATQNYPALLKQAADKESTVKNLLGSVMPQTVFDCVAYGAYSFEKDARLIYETNFLSTTRLVEMLANRPFAAFIHAGSSSEYGDGKPDMPMLEYPRPIRCNGRE